MIIEAAKSWLGTPYHSGARLKNTGVDCGMFLLEVYEAAGVVPHIDPGQYSPEWHLHRSEEKYLAWIEKYCDQITGEPHPGDIALFKFGRCVSHGGIVVEWPKIIHAYVGMGVIVSDVNEALLCDKRGESRLYAVYRPRGLNSGRSVRRREKDRNR